MNTYCVLGYEIAGGIKNRPGNFCLKKLTDLSLGGQEDGGRSD